MKINPNSIYCRCVPPGCIMYIFDYYDQKKLKKMELYFNHVWCLGEGIESETFMFHFYLRPEQSLSTQKFVALKNKEEHHHPTFWGPDGECLWKKESLKSFLSFLEQPSIKAHNTTIDQKDWDLIHDLIDANKGIA